MDETEITTAPEAVEAKKPEFLQISVITVDLDLTNEYNAPVALLDENGKRKPFVFTGNAEGTAIDHLIAWAQTLAAPAPPEVA